MASHQISSSARGRRPAGAAGRARRFCAHRRHAVYLAASYWQGAWLIGPDGRSYFHRFRQRLGGPAAGAGRTAPRPMTGRPTRPWRCWRSVTRSTAISAGTIRRHFCLWRQAGADAVYRSLCAVDLWKFPAYLAAIRAIVGEPAAGCWRRRFRLCCPILLSGKWVSERRTFRRCPALHRAAPGRGGVLLGLA